MIMWELTTDCKLFANVNHNIHLVYKFLMENDQKLLKIHRILTLKKDLLCLLMDNINSNVFNQAEAKRKELIQSKKIEPQLAEKCHSGAIYTSRSLSALISKCSFTYSTTTSFGNKEGINKKS
jgi:hypothetical protein